MPQPLTYLVDDTARTFGTIRVGHAEAFLRADDEAALTELLHHPRAATLGLRRLAPTVVVSGTPLDVLLPRLRELGAAPVVEAADGTVRVVRPDLLRARTPRAAPGPAVRAAREAARVSAVVTAVRAGDRCRASRPARGAAADADAERLAGRAARGGRVGRHGADRVRRQPRHQRRAARRPGGVEGGQLTAHDHRSDDVRTFAVHRITTVPRRSAAEPRRRLEAWTSSGTPRRPRPAERRARRARRPGAPARRPVLAARAVQRP